jgi:oligopeptide/dipeptide ABC transporter ATP-binding protein
VFNDPQHPYTLGLMGSMPAIAGRQGRLITIPGSVPAPEDMPRAAALRPAVPLQRRLRCRAPAAGRDDAGHANACLRRRWKHGRAGGGMSEILETRDLQRRFHTGGGLLRSR